MLNELKNKIKNSRIGKNFIVLLFGSGIGTIIGILNLSIILKSIGMENNGIIIMIQTYVGLFSGIFSFKSFEAIIKFLAVTIENKDYEKTKQYIKFSFILDIVSAIVSVIFAYIFLNIGFKIMGWQNDLKIFVQIYIVSLLFNVVGTPIGIIRIYNKFDSMVRIGIGVSAIKLILFIIGLLLKKGFVYFFLIELIIGIINNILILVQSIIILYKNNLGDFWKNKIVFDKEYFMFNVYSSIYTTIDLPVQQITNFIINKYLGFSEVSVYGVFTRIAGLILKVEAPLSQIVYPEMNIRIAKGEKKSAINLYKKLFKMIFATGITLTLVLLVSYDFWMKYFLSDSNIYKISFALYLAYVVYTSASRSIHDLFISLGYIKLNVRILIIVNIFYIAILFVFITTLGLNGMIISLFLQSLSVIQIKKYILRNYLR